MSQIPAENNAPKRKNIFKRLYQGELSLPLTFWGFGLLVPIALGIILALVLFSILVAQNASPPFANFIASLGAAGQCAAIVLFYLVTIAYTFVLIVAQWRAAEKYQGRKIWALLVKICSVFGAVLTVYSAPESIMVIVKLYQQV